MAKIYGDASGNILQFLQNEAEEARFPTAPIGTTSSLDFDESTNQAVVIALNTDWNSHELMNGILQRNGVPYNINPPGEQYAAKLAIKIGFPLLSDWARTSTAADAETFINAQVWQGQTIQQVNTWIDTNITNITTANVAQINARLDFIRQGLKLVASAIINMRELFILTSKLLIYIRDLVIRFRQ